jgi:hypothetical protein
VDCRVVEAVAAERLDVGCGDSGGSAGELGREVAESACSRVEPCRAIVDGGGLDELFWGALGTEVVGMRTDSVVAVVLA